MLTNVRLTASTANPEEDMSETPASYRFDDDGSTAVPVNKPNDPEDVEMPDVDTPSSPVSMDVDETDPMLMPDTLSLDAPLSPPPIDHSTSEPVAVAPESNAIVFHPTTRSGHSRGDYPGHFLLDDVPTT